LPIKRNLNLPLADPEGTLSKALGAGFDGYREDFSRAEAGEPFPFPLHLDVDITTRCDLRCPMCPTGAGGGNLFPGLGRGLSLPFRSYELALSEGEAHRLPSLRLGMTGEPLLVKGVDEWARLARERGVLDVSLVTNGQGLSPKLSGALIRAGLTRLMVSVDAGTKGGYARARPGGDFGRLLLNIESFLDARKRLGSPTPVLRLSFVDMGDRQELEAFLRLFRGAADSLAIQGYASLVPGHGARAKAGAGAGAGAPGGKAARGGGGPGAQGPEASGGGPLPRCGEPLTRLAIHADGGLFPCCSDFGRLRPLGFFPGMGLKEAWDSEGRKAVLGHGQGQAQGQAQAQEGQGAKGAHPSCLACLAAGPGRKGPPEDTA
jgi:hypothetical protein